MSCSRSNPKRATRLNFYMYVYGWICLLLTWIPLPLFLSPQDNHCLRVKLLGDCYYCVSQFESDNWKTRPDHAVCSVETGLHMIKAIKDVQLHTHVSIFWLLFFSPPCDFSRDLWVITSRASWTDGSPAYLRNERKQKSTSIPIYVVCLVLNVGWMTGVVGVGVVITCLLTVHQRRNCFIGPGNV